MSESKTFQGQVVLVTGAGSGLGRAYAEHFARLGADLVLVDIGDSPGDASPGYPLATWEDLEKTGDLVIEAGAEHILVQGDVRNSLDMNRAAAQAIAQFGRIDVLIANAGVVVKGDSWSMSDELFELQIATNLTGAWKTAKAVIPHMMERRYGRIILTSSASIYNTSKDQAGYIAAKGGVAHLAKGLAAELGEFAITVNVIAPSTVPTGANRGLALIAGVDHGEYMKRLSRSRQLIPDMLSTADVCAAVSFLASPEAGMITGITLPVDGGVSAS